MKRHKETAVAAASQPRWQLAQELAWLLLALLVPLWLNLWGQRPFELPKIMLARTLVWLLAGLVLAQYFLSHRSLRRDLQVNPLLGAVGVLALVIVSTTATAVNWRLSLWGSYERGQGAVTLLTYLLLFVLAANQLRPFPRARQLATTMAMAAGPLILFSLAQGMGWRPFGLVSDARSPLFATLGRANFLGAYLAILTPLTLALSFIARRRTLRLAWLALLAGELAVVGLTLARGAWLAAAVALASFALLQWGGRLRRRWRALAWSGVGLLFLSGPLAVLWLGQYQRGSPAARLTIWQGVIELMRGRPLLGYGADALGVMFHRVYPPQIVYYQGRDFFVDRAHNLFLDWGATAGIPGLLAFSLVLISFVIVVVQALRRPQSPQQRALLVAVLAAILGHTANNLVSFDVTPTATAVWLLMGLGVALSAPLPQVLSAATGRRSLPQWALVGLLFMGIGMGIWQANGRPLLADMAARSARQYAQTGDWAKAAAAAERAVAYWPIEPAHCLLLSQTYWQQAAADPAAAAYRQAVTLAPNNAAIYTAWGRALLEEDDPETAAPLLRQAVLLDQSNGKACIYLGAAELSLGRVEVALDDYREAVRLLPDSSQAYTGLARCYWQLGQPKEALQAVEMALQRDSQNVDALIIRQQIRDSS
ncbi:MAG: tetratricopeptide repeat protein [Anaerolineae bacterium]